MREAQRLRWRVFVGEMGARLQPAAGAEPGLDADEFDGHCEHLIIRTSETDGVPSQVVGTYRVLTPSAARRIGRLYSEDEFELSALAPLRPRLAELGRACTHPQWRSGGVILMLWSSLAQFMVANGVDAMVGCASVPMADGGHVAASLWSQLQRTSLAPPALRVRPRLALPTQGLKCDLEVEPPPLLRGYLRCGAKVLGPPAWDPVFGTADLPILMSLDEMPATYRRRFIGV